MENIHLRKQFISCGKVGLSACSSGHKAEWMNQIEELCEVLEDMGIHAVRAPHILSAVDDYSGTDRERAEDLMRFYRDDSIDAIFDISGGNLANGVLRFLDYDIIAGTEKVFWGYSDLTTVINAIYAKTGKTSVLYQVKNMVWSEAELQRRRFAEFISGDSTQLLDFQYEFLQGREMEGVVAGGNIRCLLKLAGTEYWPDMKGKILFLESLGAEGGHIATALNQLDHMGVFDQAAGVLLGTFTNHEKGNYHLSVFDMLRMHISKDLPVAHTGEIGHGTDSKAIVIGEYRYLS